MEKISIRPKDVEIKMPLDALPKIVDVIALLCLTFYIIGQATKK